MLAVLAGIVAGLKLLGGIVAGVRATGSMTEGLLGVFVVPIVLLVGTLVLLPRAALRRRLRSVAVVLGTTGCGAGFVAMLGPLVQWGPFSPWLAGGAALAVCSSGALIAILVACAVLDDGERAVP